ncbi:uncharacterized protein BcabD6B2_21060 [Babesia caballi]|uniref:Variant erythrocyte surface antigen-1, beta subunit n=1 Tax=Babesia caballi TaxID=5871 RepID=A0AAV4LR79_BABCB|nr:hypothetical protein, conserved [Babesia caballi]
MASKSGKSLTDCPSNLKEAIDWILRVTGKDKQGSQSNAEKLGTAVQALLSTSGVTQVKREIKINQDLINNLADGLAKFIGYDGTGTSNNLGKEGIGYPGTVQDPGYNSVAGYKLTYHRTEATWATQVESGYGSSETKKDICAKIFMGCVPMIFSALSYLYWRCDQPVNQGGWMGSGLKSAGPLKNFMVGMGYKPSELNERMKGSEIFESIEQEKLKDFFDAMTKAKSASVERFQKEEKKKEILYPSYRSSVSASSPTYLEFLEEIRKKAPEKLDNHETPLSTLYYCAACYFQCLHTNNATRFTKTPQSIRELLYFLAALPFSPSYESLNDHVSTLLQNLASQPTKLTDAELMIPVADSGIQSPHNTLSAAELKDHLTTSCSLSLTVLGIIQGHGASENPNKPWLHECFSNSAFYLNYPSSGPTLFSSLSSYTYALQFQLYFLYAQCAGTYSEECGWRGCKYGSTVKSENVTSHICSAGCDKQHQNGDHSSGSTCKHKPCEASPLQAFLTDTLKGFSLSPSSTTGHLSDHPPGFMCHVPMGFQSNHLRENAGTGNYLYSTLKPFCGSPDTPLRQLSEKLGCLTKRTPQTLGDVFGFIWHLNGQLFNNVQVMYGFKTAVKQKPHSVEDFVTKFKTAIRSHKSRSSPEESGLVKSFESMAPAIPFLYQMFSIEESNSVPDALFDLTYHCHKWETGNSGNRITLVHKDHSGQPCSTINDLWSLYQPVAPAQSQLGGTDPYKACRDKNCGGYLYSLTHSYGSTYAPSYASAYLSWVSYLVDDLATGLQEMFDVFKGLNCTDCSSCSSGYHGASQDSRCPSIVDCDGVLPLLYRHGFQYYDARWLKGMKFENNNNRRVLKPDAQNKKSCSNFNSQLSKVLSPDAPLAKLLETIDSFLYLFRFYFFYNLSTFWLCSLAILLYFLIYGIDVLHFKSHVRFPSSHELPPIGLLTTGKAPALTQLTYYMP